jgi:superfamily II DNA or RNA helicase
MSRKIPYNDLSDEDLAKIGSDLQVQPEPSKYAFNTTPATIYLCDSEGNFIYTPFAYPGPENVTPERPARKELDSTNPKFEGKLREAQKEVKNEAIDKLNSTGSVIIAAYPGYGKCLAKNTPVITHDGDLKMSQDIRAGDNLMGDDSTPRKVLSTCQGKEQLWKITPETGDTFTVNESHILCLYHTGKNIYFNVTVGEYIRNYQDSIKAKLRLYRTAVEFPDRETEDDPYTAGRALKLRDDVRIPRCYVVNSTSKRLLYLAGILDASRFVRITDDALQSDYRFLCRSLGFCVGENSSVFCLSGMLSRIPCRVRKFKDDVESVLFCKFRAEKVFGDDTYYGFTLDGNRKFLLGDFTVTHNTITSIYIACKIRLKTLILCHRIVLVNQWKESIQKFCPDAKVQILTSKTKMQDDADFYIMNAANVPKHGRDFYRSVGFLIVDEVHIIMAEKMSHCMRYITPRYTLGLSATPYRTDGLDILLDMYFGTHKIVRKLFRKHVAYRVDTGFKPEVKLNRMGKVDWGSVLESQCSNRDRNELIVSLVKFFPDRVFLVLCKRVDQANYLVDRLVEEGEDVTSLIGSNQVFERSSRVLVGTVQKTGVGFDHPRLNSLILASDVEQYFVQYLGRVFRREDTVPWIFDLLDDYSLLKKHYNTRRGVYSEHGGLVKDFRKEFPEFFS